jgi:hypothetical protein
MAAYHLGDYAAASGCPKALLLCGEAVSPEDERLARLIDCLRVPWQPMRGSELGPSGDWEESTRGGRFCVMTSASSLGPILARTARADLPSWMRDQREGSQHDCGASADIRERRFS